MSTSTTSPELDSLLKFKEREKRIKKESIENAKKYDLFGNIPKITNVKDDVVAMFKKNLIMWALFFYCIFVAITFYNAYNNSDKLFDQKYTYIATFLIPLIAIAFLYFKAENILKVQNAMILAVGGLVLFIFYMLSFYVKPMGIAFQSLTSYLFIILIFFMVIVGLAIFFKVFINSAKRMTGWTGFIMEFIFFLPCLLTDLLDYLRKEIDSTPNTIFILLIAEVCLVLAYVYLPYLINKQITKDSVMIRNTPVRIDGVKILKNNLIFIQDTQDALKINGQKQDTSILTGKINGSMGVSMTDASGSSFMVSEDVSGTYLYTSNFALSMWVFVNGKDIGTDEKTIFKYGCPDDTSKKYGKPSIHYLTNDRWKFNFSETKDTTGTKYNSDKYSTTLQIPPQKWNNIVFNYYDNQVDLFVNGNLETNMNLSSNPIKHFSTDVISVGSKNGIQGAICNVRFFPNPLKLNQITQAYNLLYSTNPPLNSFYSTSTDNRNIFSDLEIPKFN